MSDTAIAPAQQSTEAISESMTRNGIVMSAKTQQKINQLKSIDSHFFSVGKYKDANGEWQDKVEPDAFAVQTMATVQAISTEVLSMLWENADDLMRAAVTVRVRGWKGPKDKPEIEKTVELRLSMKAVAAKYVMDKLEPKRKWNNNTKQKEESAPEWTENDVILGDDGWVMPKSFKHQVAMRSYLVDQYNFLGRTAETKAERRVNLKLVGFDWRDPDEINDENRETAVVQKSQPTVDPAELISRILACASAEDLDLLTQMLTVEMGKLTKDGQEKVMSALKEKRAGFQAPKPATKEPTDDEMAEAERKGMQADSTPAK